MTTNEELDREVEQWVNILESYLEEDNDRKLCGINVLIELLQSQQQSLKLLQKVSSKDKEDLVKAEQRIKELEDKNIKAFPTGNSYEDIKILYLVSLERIKELEKLYNYWKETALHYTKELDVKELLNIPEHHGNYSEYCEAMKNNPEQKQDEDNDYCDLCGTELTQELMKINLEFNEEICSCAEELEILNLRKDLQESEQLLLEILKGDCSDDEVTINIKFENHNYIASFLEKRGYLEKVSENVYKVKEKRE